jgi:hypothetical protein
MTIDREQFEAGDEPVEVERRARAGVVVSVRLTPDEADRLQELAAERNTTLSRLGREAIVRLLDDGNAPSRSPAGFSPSWTVMSTFPVISSEAPKLITKGDARTLTSKPSASS